MRAALLLLVFLSVASSAAGQVTTATFYGIVADGSGAALPGAAVTMRHEGTGATMTKTSDPNGEFVFSFMPVGVYTLRIELAGFKTYESQNFELGAAQNVRRRFTLELGKLEEKLTVTGETPLVNPVAPEQRENYSQLQISELPLGRRNFSNILRIGTGVTPAGEGGFRLNGIGRNGTRITVDGTDASGNPEGRSTSMYQGFQYVDLVSIEAIQEVQTIKGVIPAEYGHALSGNVNVITRSGTNIWHGSAFENHQEDSLNARNPFLTTKPALEFNQFGTSVGGPLRRDRSFFFGTYEGYRETADSLVQGEVPTEQLRTRLIAADPAYRLALDSLPLPNQPHVPTANTAQYQAVHASSARDDHAVLKVDTRLFLMGNVGVTYTRGRPFRLTPRVSPVNPRTFQGIQERVTGSFTLAAGRWTSETRFGYNFNDIDRIDRFWDFVDPNKPESFYGGRRIPTITALGFSTADSEIAEYGRGGVVWSLEQKYARTAGRHTFKFGALYSTRGGGRSNVENARIRYENLDDLLANIPSRVQVTFGVNPYTSRSYEFGAFAQDDWRVTSRLVLNLGLRYDYFSNFVAKPAGEFPAGLFNLDGLRDPENFVFGPFRDPNDPFDPDPINIGPRAGFAWTTDDTGRTVVRGGASLMFSPLVWGTFNNAVSNGPTQPFRVIYTKTEALAARLRFPVYNEDVLPLVEGSTQTQVSDIFDPGIHAPYSVNTYLGVQRALGPTLMVETAYVGTMGYEFPQYRTFNPVDRVTGRRPNPSLGEGNYIDNSQTTSYHSWQTSVRKRFARNLSFGAHYTWGKSLSYTGGDIGATFQGDASNSTQDFHDWRANKGPSTGDITHLFVGDWVYGLPMLVNRHAAIRHALGGWQVTGVVRANTGPPFNVSEPSSRSASRPDIIDYGHAILGDFRTTRQYLNPAAFAAVPKSSVSGATLRPGNYGNNALRGPGLVSLDLSLAKNFELPYRLKFQVRADMFNAFNRVNYTTIVTNIESRTFGQLTGAAGPRAIQLNARITF
jgi:Carboxypeptidase regulatory-like domain/TonB dependent receptor-like, beta-barrel